MLDALPAVGTAGAPARCVPDPLRRLTERAARPAHPDKLPAVRIALCLLALVLLACSGLGLGAEGDESDECRDGADNDQNGDFDCDDEGCRGSPDCPRGGQETDTDTDTDADSDTDADVDDCGEGTPTGTLETAWEPSAFQDGEAIDGSDGWASGYADDPWGAYKFEGVAWAYSASDDGGGEWGDSGPNENWLVNPGVEMRHGGIAATTYMTDDDTLGLALGDGSGTMWLFLLCGAEDAEAPNCPVTLRGETGSVIVEVNGGEATVLAESGSSYGREEIGELYFMAYDGRLIASWPDGDVELEAELGSRPTIRAAGFYAYEAGLAGQDQTTAWFSEPLWLLFDNDDDGVPDDNDACPLDATRQ